MRPVRRRRCASRRPAAQVPPFVTRPATANTIEVSDGLIRIPE